MYGYPVDGNRLNLISIDVHSVDIKPILITIHIHWMEILKILFVFCSCPFSRHDIHWINIAFIQWICPVNIYQWKCPFIRCPVRGRKTWSVAIRKSYVTGHSKGPNSYIECHSKRQCFPECAECTDFRNVFRWIFVRVKIFYFIRIQYLCSEIFSLEQRFRWKCFWNL